MQKGYQRELKLTYLNLNSKWTDKLTSEEIDKLRERAIEELKYMAARLYGSTGYRYVMDRFPLKYDDELPNDVINALTSKGTFACASQDGVFFDTELLLDNVIGFYTNEKVTKKLGNDNERLFNKIYFGLQAIINDVLRHEYGHIVNGHIFLTYPNDDLKTKAIIYTNEIEANRTIEYEYRSDYLKLTAVSDDNEPFTCCKQCLTRQGIYTKILEMLKNNKQEKDNKSKETSGNSSDTGNGDKEQNNSPIASDKYKDLPDIEDGIYHGKDTNKATSKEDAMKTLCQEIGVRPTKEITKNIANENVNEMLTEFHKVFRNKEIQKCVSKLKGYVKGDLCKDKKQTYSRQTRKSTEDGILRKGVKTDKNKRPNILVALDASGSMSKTSIKTVSDAIKTVINTIGRNSSEISICTFNTSIIEKSTLKDWDDVVQRYCSHGGTNFCRVMELALDKDADIVLCVGDGQDCLYKSGIDNKEGKELPKWVDIVIEGDPTSIDQIKMNYSKDEREGDIERETLWVGHNTKEINKALGNI